MTDEAIKVTVDADLEDLVPGFMANRLADLDTIRELVGRGEMDEVRGIGHRLKGVGGGYGFQLITDLGAKIEQAAIAGDAGDVAACVDRLEHYLKTVEIVYQESE